MESLGLKKNHLSVFKNKKVFITGHTGFKGSWLLYILNKIGAIVKGYSLEPYTKQDLFYTINGTQLCQHVIGDIRNFENFKKEVLSFNPDFIFHLAAQPLVIESYTNSLYTYQTNFVGTINLLEILKELNNPCVSVFITTDKVYKNIEANYAYKEEDALGGYDPYSSSKACADIAISSYRSSFFNNDSHNKHHQSIAIARAGNVIGGGDWSENRLIPDIVKALSNNEDVVLRNPKSVRPWQHVLDPLNGYLILASKMFENNLEFNDTFNFGPDENDKLTVEQVAEIAVKSFGKKASIKTDKKINFHEANLLMLNNSKAKNILNWFPRWTSKQAVQKTMDWYTNKTSIEDQIAEFYDL